MQQYFGRPFTVFNQFWRSAEAQHICIELCGGEGAVYASSTIESSKYDGIGGTSAKFSCCYCLQQSEHLKQIEFEIALHEQSRSTWWPQRMHPYS